MQLLAKCVSGNGGPMNVCVCVCLFIVLITGNSQFLKNDIKERVRMLYEMTK